MRSGVLDRGTLVVPEVSLPTGSLVIADLHLDVERDGATDAFVRWLDGIHGRPRLLILGDLFEYWVGPAQIEHPGAQEVLAALSRLAATGTEIDVVPGNRDFLLDDRFERASACRIRFDGVVGETDGGMRVLFLHGDEFATHDIGHQRLRRLVRSRWFRRAARRIPRFVAFRIARAMRRTSKRSTRQKGTHEMALQPNAVRAAAKTYGADVVVCGHAHRWVDEEVPDGPRWVVLDAFGGKRGVLEVRADSELAPRDSDVPES